MPRDCFSKITAYYKAIQSNQPQLLLEVAAPNFKLITSTHGDIELSRLIALIGLFNHRISYELFDINKIGKSTYIASGKIQILFPPKDFFTSFKVQTTFEFNNGKIETVTPIIDLPVSDLDSIRNIFREAIARAKL